MKINIRDKDNVIILDIEGEIKRSIEYDVALHQTVKDQLNAGKRNLLLNFEKVDYIDSFGVGEILASYISTHNSGGKLKLTKLAKKLYIIFQVTMLTRVLEIYEEEEIALKSFLKN